MVLSIFLLVSNDHYCFKSKVPVPPHELNWSVPEAVEKKSSQLVTVQQALTTVKEKPYTLDHHLWSALPLRKFWSAKDIASAEEASFSFGKVRHLFFNAQSKFRTARRKYVDVWFR